MLDGVPVGNHRLGVVGGDRPEHVWVAPDQLVVDPFDHIDHGEPTLLLGDGGVELDLVQQVAQLLDQCRIGRRLVGVECLERIDDFIGLFEEVLDQRLMGLLLVPRALLAQRARQLVEPHQRGADRRAEPGDVDAREMVGLDGAIELSPRGVHDVLVGRSQPLQDHHRLVTGRCLDGQLDVAEHPVGMRVGNEHRSVIARCCRGELVAVDQPNAGLDRVHTEAGEGDVEERHRRQDRALDSAVGAEMTNAALQHQRRSRHGIEDVAMGCRRGNETFGDLGVDVGEGVGRFIDVVERGRLAHQRRRGVARRADVPVRRRSNRVERLLGDVLRPARAEPDDRDVRPTAGHELSVTTEPLAGSQRP